MQSSTTGSSGIDILWVTLTPTSNTLGSNPQSVLYTGRITDTRHSSSGVAFAAPCSSLSSSAFPPCLARGGISGPAKRLHHPQTARNHDQILRALAPTRTSQCPPEQRHQRARPYLPRRLRERRQLRTSHIRMGPSRWRMASTELKMLTW